MISFWLDRIANQQHSQGKVEFLLKDCTVHSNQMIIATVAVRSAITATTAKATVIITAGFTAR